MSSEGAATATVGGGTKAKSNLHYSLPKSSHGRPAAHAIVTQMRCKEEKLCCFQV